MKLTYEVIESLGTLKGGIALNSYQLRLLGIAWPPQHGWVSELLETEISDNLFGLLMELKGPRKKRERATILARHGITASRLFCSKVGRFENL
jgi:hypothetical protein